MECERAQNLLDAYFDEELDPVLATEVELHVQNCPRCAALLESRKSLQQALRTKLPYYRAPASLRTKLAGDPSQTWRRLSLALAACLLLAVGGLTWSIATHSPGHPLDPTMQLADAIESDHVRSLLTSDHLTDVLSSNKHTVKPWFAGKLSFAPPVTDLTSDGFPLVGGRLDVLEHQTIAALVYQRDKHIINLFIRPSGSAAEPSGSLTTARGYHILHWSSDGMEFWAVSDVEARELDHFAELHRAATAPTNH